MNFRFFVIFLLIAGFVLPSFGLAQTAQPPQTMEEAQVFGMNILERLPNAIKDVWHNQALPLWWNMWVWTKGFWDSTLGSKVQGLWEKLWGLTEQATPDVKGEFQKEKQEIQKDLWERFKGLF